MLLVNNLAKTFEYTRWIVFACETGHLSIDKITKDSSCDVPIELESSGAR